MTAAIEGEKIATAQKGEVLPDPAWQGVYRVGGVCLLLTGAIYLIGAVLSVMMGPAPSDGEKYLNSVAGHLHLAQINFGLFALTDFLLLPAALAFFLALKHIAKNAMLIASGLTALFIVLDLAVTEMNSLTLVTLTQHFAAAASETQRAAYVAAADYALATLPIATFYSYVLSSAGFLITSIVMLKGPFSKPTAFLGITACLEGIVGGFYVVFPALAALLIPSLVTFGIWSFFAGSRLCRLGKRQHA